MTFKFTPPDLAERVVEWAGVGGGSRCPHSGRLFSPMRVLEPCAGNGTLVRPLVAAGAKVTAIEIDQRYAGELYSLTQGACFPVDFLQLAHAPGDALIFDLCVMHPPPDEGGLDVNFIDQALKFAPRVVGIFRSSLLHGGGNAELWSRVRPRRIAYCEFPEVRFNPVVCELVAAERATSGPWATDCTVEWWGDLTVPALNVTRRGRFPAPTG